MFSKGTFSSGMSDDPLIAVLAEAARLGEAALEAGDQADFGTLIDLAVQAGPSVTSVHSEDTSDVIPSAAEISCATSIADELGRLSEAAVADSRASEAEACFARLEAASGALEMRTALRSAGAIVAAVRVLGRSRSNARVQESGCRALARFAGADRQSRVCASEAGAAKTARSAIETHPEEDLVGDEASAITLIIAITIATALSLSLNSAPALALAPGPTQAGALLCALALLRPDGASPLQPAEPHTEPDVADEDLAFFAAARRKQQGGSSLSPAEAAAAAVPDADATGMVTDMVTDMVVDGSTLDGSTLPQWPLTLEEAPLGLEPQFLELLAPAAGAAAAAEPEVLGAPQPWPALREAELTGELV